MHRVFHRLWIKMALYLWINVWLCTGLSPNRPLLYITHVMGVCVPPDGIVPLMHVRGSPRPCRWLADGQFSTLKPLSINESVLGGPVSV
jgi:hypothetical protein